MDNYRVPCTYCGRMIIEGLHFCPHCGKQQPKPLSEEELSKNPYKILGVPEDAEPIIIEAAYKSLARKYHPDTNPPPGSEDQMRDINWAHGILIDQKKLLEWKRKNGRENKPFSSKGQQPSATTNNSDRTSASIRVPHGTDPTPKTKAYDDLVRHSAKPKNSVWKTIGTVTVVILLCIMSVLFYNSLASHTIHRDVQISTAKVSTDYSTPTVRKVVKKTATPTTELPNCTLWSSLSKADVGEKRCVYGSVVKVYGTDVYRQIIRFSVEAGTFLIWGEKDFYGVSVGDCIAAIGEIHQNPSSLYMDIAGAEFIDFPNCR
jgi:hypothetical protein